jgi:hypothetical protein
MLLLNLFHSASTAHPFLHMQNPLLALSRFSRGGSRKTDASSHCQACTKPPRGGNSSTGLPTPFSFPVAVNTTYANAWGTSRKLWTARGSRGISAACGKDCKRRRRRSWSNTRISMSEGTATQEARQRNTTTPFRQHPLHLLPRLPSFFPLLPVSLRHLISRLFPLAHPPSLTSKHFLRHNTPHSRHLPPRTMYNHVRPFPQPPFQLASKPFLPPPRPPPLFCLLSPPRRIQRSAKSLLRRGRSLVGKQKEACCSSGFEGCLRRKLRWRRRSRVGLGSLRG